jgi:hypothetical protein
MSGPESMKNSYSINCCYAGDDATTLEVEYNKSQNTLKCGFQWVDCYWQMCEFMGFNLTINSAMKQTSSRPGDGF